MWLYLISGRKQLGMKLLNEGEKNRYNSPKKMLQMGASNGGSHANDCLLTSRGEHCDLGFHER
jgi:hypothetical protein